MRLYDVCRAILILASAAHEAGNPPFEEGWKMKLIKPILDASSEAAERFERNPAGTQAVLHLVHWLVCGSIALSLTWLAMALLRT